MTETVGSDAGVAEVPCSRVTMRVNGEQRTVTCEDRSLLVHTVRDELGLKGTRIGCMNGDCGACTLSVNGAAVKSCLVLTASAAGADIVTVEGVAQDGELTPLQRALWQEDAFQCGYCILGALFAGQELLDENPTPTESEIREALIGNLCRCTGYANMVKAIQRVAGDSQED